jgi:putative Holliday junction resolvase
VRAVARDGPRPRGAADRGGAERRDGLCALARQGKEAEQRAIAELVARHCVDEVVVGLPRRLDGSLGPEAEAARAYAGWLKTFLPCPVVLWDERLSTRQAERALLEGDLSRKRRRSVIDQTAAALILQAYLDRRRTVDPV